MAPTRPPGSIGKHVKNPLDSGTLSRTNSPTPTPAGSRSTHPDVADADVVALKELGLDLLGLALDLAGIVDPTPISDGASGLLALARGQWFDAIVSGVSMVPYVGDLAKAGKLPKYLKSIEKAVELAERSAKAAEILMPGIRKIKQALDLIPNGANKLIDEMKRTVDRFVATRAGAAIVKQLPDISRHFRFKTFERNGHLYQEASGKLGVPGSVKTHRSKSAQSSVSAGSGDDAGHLIGNRFGAPGTAENLSKQNWIANQHGTFHQLEDQWAAKLKSGTGIEVKVTDVTRHGEDRPFMRKVEWKETAPNGSTSHHELTFANTHTPKSRDKQGIPPTVSGPQSGNVINADFINKRRLP